MSPRVIMAVDLPNVLRSWPLANINEAGVQFWSLRDYGLTQAAELLGTTSSHLEPRFKAFAFRYSLGQNIETFLEDIMPRWGWELFIKPQVIDSHLPMGRQGQSRYRKLIAKARLELGVSLKLKPEAEHRQVVKLTRLLADLDHSREPAATYLELREQVADCVTYYEAWRVRRDIDDDLQLWVRDQIDPAFGGHPGDTVVYLVGNDLRAFMPLRQSLLELGCPAVHFLMSRQTLLPSTIVQLTRNMPTGSVAYLEDLPHIIAPIEPLGS